jgi:hypothetical protein
METRLIAVPSAVFIHDSARVPLGFRFSFEQRDGWKKLLGVNGYAVELGALALGWHFICIAQRIKTSSTGYSLESAMDGAVRKAMRAAAHLGFNSLEVTEIVPRRLLIMHYVSVFSQPRHLRPDPFIRDLNRYRQYRVPIFPEIYWRAAELPPQSKGI